MIFQDPVTYDGLGVLMTLGLITPFLDLSLICHSNESIDFTSVGMYNALTVSILAVGSTLDPVSHE